MADLHEIKALIARHIEARAEHDRLFALNDQGLETDKAVIDALDPLNDALIALCSARPSGREATARRAEYLVGRVWNEIEGCDGLCRKVIAALIGAAGEA